MLDDPPCVRMFSPVLEDVEADDRLFDRLNELNAGMRLVRFFVVEGRVIVVAEMFVAPFAAEHVKRACVVVGSLADEFGGMLQKEFGGLR
ncbi:MAG TPA: YbjN domain-containing protein, partial [Thermoanaerobaculia bacterium]